jgi:defect in organelle trafficking protein DotA
MKVTKVNVFFRIVLVLLFFFPQVSWGFGVFDVSPEDKSLQYLGQIFGTIPGTQIQAPNEAEGIAGSPLIAQVVYIFNQVVFLLGIVIVVYTGVVGTIRTAQEGEFLGKSWHSLFVPLRAVIGVFMLLPSYGGYNWIQITVMWFIIQGVGAANSLWQQVILTNLTQGSIHTDTRLMQLSNPQVSSAVNALFLGDLCMTLINNDAATVKLLGDYITPFQFANQI